MRIFGNYIWLCIIIVISLMGITGCGTDIREEIDGLFSEVTETVEFTPYLKTLTKSADTHTYVYDSLHMEVCDWVEDSVGNNTTKASPMMLLEGKLGITMFAFDEWSDTATSLASSTNAEYTFDGNTLNGQKLRWSNVKDKSNLRVYAYAPYVKIDKSVITGVPTLSYTINSDVEEQEDIIAAVKEVNITDNAGARIPLEFKHILTGIKFRTGFGCTVNSIKVVGVSGSGQYSIGGSWDNLSESNAEYNIEFTKPKELLAGTMITNNNTTLMLIPQTLGDNAKVIMNYTVGGTTKNLSASLSGITWEPGKMITYTLFEKTAGGNVIYFDLAAGNVMIGCTESTSNNPTATNTYLGYVFRNGKAEAVTGTHNDNFIYYVYQTDNLQNSTIPNTPPLKYNGKTWAEFIENNTSVAGVITGWKNAASTQGSGRSATNNMIRVYGSNKTVNLTIDDIYTTYQQRSTARTTAGICFNAGSNAHLIINIEGDNRVGAVHYYGASGKNNTITFEGTGSLTVAAASGETGFYNTTNNGEYIGETAQRDTTFFDNHWCSAIGGNDSGEGNSHGIIINSGNIFAGTTKAENCTAIGAGGNDAATITINGGTVTAIASTTGTAIGGGIGYNSAGGSATVTINAGNVYAYNHSNRWDIPSAAIGGAGSRKEVGNNGTVYINGGNVYAQSAIGTAIGGGSSKTKRGGAATVVITGGNITAKSVAAISGETPEKTISAGASIGGGTGCSGGIQNNKDIPVYGGNAEIRISGNPVILTGSIGGGKSGHAQRGNIGTAKIEISGGDIQAQFVMAGSVLDGAQFTPPSFKMTNGLIRNSKVSDPEFFHIVNNGGAVYMEDGTFTMSGGTIMDCYGENGGAIYIKKGAKTENQPTFSMSGGDIAKCTALYDGGAIYLEDGIVKLSNDAIIRSCITGKNGSGGAICVKKTGLLNPSFTMSGGTMSNNVAYLQGGALHLEGGDVTISGGTINGNLVNDGNGGGISINSGSFIMPEVTGNGALITGNSAISKSTTNSTSTLYENTGLGGGVYITSLKDYISVDILSGAIIGNSSTRRGGGICVDLPETGEVAATVTIGTTTEGVQHPDISSNLTLLQGGGLYINGSKASVVINSGRIIDNSTVSYVDNPDVMNVGGMVTLNGGEVRSVDVIYHANGDEQSPAYFTYSGKTEDVQRIVIDTNNKLMIKEIPFRNGYRFVRWNTRSDGLGTLDYKVGTIDNSDGQIEKRSSNLNLYAIWEVAK